MSKHYFIGIDPGLDGGIAVVNRDGRISDLEGMPVIGKGRRELDAARLHEILGVWVSLCKPEPISVHVEKVASMPKQGVRSVFTFGQTYGATLAVLAVLGIRTELVTPQAWKKVVLAGTPKDKDAAVAYCRRAFPGAQLVPPRCRVPHDGLADALCIAEYGRRMAVGVKEVKP